MTCRSGRCIFLLKHSSGTLARSSSEQTLHGSSSSIVDAVSEVEGEGLGDDSTLRDTCDISAWSVIGKRIQQNCQPSSFFEKKMKCRLEESGN